MEITRFEGRPGRPYVPMIRAGELVFTAGYTGFRPDGSVPDDFGEQVNIILDRARTNLERAGSSLDRVISATVYLTDQARDRPEFDRIFSEAFRDAPPTRSCVEIQALSDPAKRIEISFIAAVKEAG